MKSFNPKVFDNWMDGIISGKDFRKHLLAQGWEPMEIQKTFFSIPKDKLKKQMHFIDRNLPLNGTGSSAAHFL
jgi:hypothetical protein